jgi:hypothetical protein
MHIYSKTRFLGTKPIFSEKMEKNLVFGKKNLQNVRF